MILFLIFAVTVFALVCIYIGAPVLRERAVASRGHFATLSVLGFLPLIAAGIYLKVGMPAALSGDAVPPSPQAPVFDAATIAQLPEQERQQMIAAMVANLRDRLEHQDGSIDEWRMLTRSYGALGERQLSIETWEKIAARTDALLTDKREYAIAWVSARQSDQEAIDTPMQSLLGELLDANPQDPLPLYFLGIAAKQDGNPARAIELWTTLEAQVPETAPLKLTLQQLIEDAHDGN